MRQTLGSQSIRYRVPLFGAVAIGLVIGGLAIKPLLAPATPSPRLMAEARTALQRKQYADAERLACRIRPSDKLYPQALLLAGEAATRADRFDDAIKHYAAVPRDDSQSSIVAAFAMAELWRDRGHLSKAEREYTYVLEREPANLAAHERMAFLVGVSGRKWESLPHFMALMKSGSATFDELALLGDLDRPVEQPDYLKRSAQNAPDDVLVQLGLAAQAVYDKRSADALSLLKKVVARDPDLIAAQTLLGELLVDADAKDFIDWHAQLPTSADDHPDTWFVRGLWARHSGQMDVAARCFWEALRRDPTHRRATYQLGQVLAALNAPAAADFAERSRHCFEMSQALDAVLRFRGQDERSVIRVIELMECTGRIWEACAWASLAAQTFSMAEQTRQTAERLSAQLSDDLPRTIPSANLTSKWDLSAYPGYSELLAISPSKPMNITTGHRPSSIHFVETTGVGFDFVYSNSADPATPGARMFEQTGGGVAVLDLDGDSLPDLYLTQGTEWPTGSPEPKPTGKLIDQLFRNVGGTSFIDVTRQSGLVDSGFGQGCTAGDFDNDGFADLYVANIGRNQLYRNNGDGTFSDVTASVGMIDHEWTTSCAMVDLNADSFPDLISVTYLNGPDIFEVICHQKACSPKSFDGVPDRIYINRGDGTFELMPAATSDASSKGLGIVAFTSPRRDRPFLFIANDQTPNFLLQNSPSSDRFNLHLTNEGFISGLAFNQDGLAMASMGIAADDVNGDGRIDFYVTTFKDEPKILFLQDASGLFVDATTASGLGGPGLPFVGWGTQFLDADCDGEPDLVTVNGHIDDYRREGGEFQMRSQFFRNTGSGRFVELQGPHVGDWFERKLLGRGLARLDWNRDGRMDFVVSNIGDPASLVTNQSQNVCHFVNVRLHATTSARDAIGSTVDVVTDRRRLSKQLVAGDGYMASNERMLQFGLGDCQTVNQLEVTWPSGIVSTVKDVPADATVVFIEGRPRCSVSGTQTPSELEVALSTRPNP